MNRSALALAAALSVAAFAAQAETPEAAGQFAQPAAGSATRAQVEAQLRTKGVNTYSISYNPVAGFQGQKSRAQVQAEFVASRDAVAAMTGEDSGSAYLAANRGIEARRYLAGTPVNAR